MRSNANAFRCCWCMLLKWGQLKVSGGDTEAGAGSYKLGPEGRKERRGDSERAMRQGEMVWRECCGTKIPCLDPSLYHPG